MCLLHVRTHTYWSQARKQQKSRPKSSSTLTHLFPSGKSKWNSSDIQVRNLLNTTILTLQKTPSFSIITNQDKLRVGVSLQSPIAPHSPRHITCPSSPWHSATRAWLSSPVELITPHAASRPLLCAWGQSPAHAPLSLQPNESWCRGPRISDKMRESCYRVGVRSNGWDSWNAKAARPRSEEGKGKEEEKEAK